MKTNEEGIMGETGLVKVGIEDGLIGNGYELGRVIGETDDGRKLLKRTGLVGIGQADFMEKDILWVKGMIPLTETEFETVKKGA